MRTLRSNAEKPFRVLVVDDQPAMAGITALILATLGYEVIQCHSPDEALDRLKHEPLDMLLSDYGMPSMTGLDLVARMRSEGCTIPVIIMSGRIAAIDRTRAKQLGIRVILEKPFGMAQLQEAVRKVLP